MPEIGHYCILLAQARLMTSVFLDAAYQHRGAVGRLAFRLTFVSIICEKTHPRATAALVWVGLPSRTVLEALGTAAQHWSWAHTSLKPETASVNTTWG